MSSGSEEVTIYCHTREGMSIGMAVGKLVEHGAELPPSFGKKPYIRFRPPGADEDHILIVEGREPYLLILRGIDYPDPPPPFVMRPGRKLYHEFTKFKSKHCFRKNIYYDVHSLKSQYLDLLPEFDRFIGQFADRIVVHYRSQNTAHLAYGSQRSDATQVSPLDFDWAEAPRDDTVEEAGFDSGLLQDERRRFLAERVLRPGQRVFRDKAMRAYGGRCAITGCDLPAALEAAHIIPYCGPTSDHVSNGILLRIDLHALFDAYLLAIDPKNLTVRLESKLQGGYYEVINGRRLRMPADVACRPSLAALARHFEVFARRDGLEAAYQEVEHE